MKVKSIISNFERTKEEEITEYLNSDNGYWFKNDIWNIKDEVFGKFGVKTKIRRLTIDFSYISKNNLKNEIKYYLCFNLKSYKLEIATIFNTYQYVIKNLIEYVVKYLRGIKSFNEIKINQQRWKIFIIEKGYKINESSEISDANMRYGFNLIPAFIKDFYDDRNEVEKDIWNLSRIVGIRNSASKEGSKVSLNFTIIDEYYREMVKRYFRTIITKRSVSHCKNMLTKIDYFFKKFYSKGYKKDFLKDLNREDMEMYFYQINMDFNDKNITYRSKFVSQIRIFLEYIKLAMYEKAPEIEIAFLIFSDDIPKRENRSEEVKRAKFIPEPIITEIDNNINYLDKPQYIDMYVLLRETGWRGTDILNLRYNNCLEKIWRPKEEKYSYLLCGEITKTGIANLKIPIKDEIANLIKKRIEILEELSTEFNNPSKYLFNTFEGKRMGLPLGLSNFVLSLRRLIKSKDIRIENSELYHFTTHQLRHTRAREYINQNVSLTTIQEILGHTSLQMTLHYAKVSESKVYEEWKKTKELGIFNLDMIDVSSKVKKSKEDVLKYEYISENLDGVKVPFGMCFKPSKIDCKQQTNHCFNCGSFCTTSSNITEYENEIEQVKLHLKRSEELSKELWIDSNKKYLETLENMLKQIKRNKIVHKNFRSREVKYDER